MNELDLAKKWLQYAQNDLIVAKHCFEYLYPKQLEIACYHCQQSAEKSMKGYLMSQKIEPPKIHNLIELCQLCMAKNDEFSNFLDVCADLTPYGVALRYPNEYAPDGIIVKLSIDKAQQIYFFALLK